VSDRATTRRLDILALALLALPLAVTLAKLPIFPGAAALANVVTAAGLTADLRAIALDIVFVPLGALVVLAFRLTLGLRVLGLFRPILLAFAFDAIGMPLALGLLIPILLFVLLLRPLLAGGHNYARMAVLLSLVAVLLLVPLVIGSRWNLAWLQRLAHFPLIALCLTCESFARTVDRDGVPEALWRALMTVAAAAAIAALATLARESELFLRFPELLLTQAGCVLLIRQRLSFRLFDGTNPLNRRASAEAVECRLPVHPSPEAGGVPIQGEAG
jgi:uncharacterized protein with transglutaminase domain